MTLIPSYWLTERCPLWTVEDTLSLYASSGLMSRATNKRIPTTTHLERRTDLLGGCTGLYLICCYLTVLQRCHNWGESSSTSSLWAFPHLWAEPHTSPLQPLLSCCSEERCALMPTTLQVRLFYLHLLSFCLVFPSNVSQAKAVSSSHSICTYTNCVKESDAKTSERKHQLDKSGCINMHNRGALSRTARSCQSTLFPITEKSI